MKNQSARAIHGEADHTNKYVPGTNVFLKKTNPPGRKVHGGLDGRYF